MKYLTVAQAARRTGLSERAIYDRIGDQTLTAHGVKLRIPEDSLTKFIVDRHQAAAAQVRDLTAFAEQVRKHVQEIGGLRGTWTKIDRDALKIFGPHVVRAAGMTGNRGCRWCWARMSADVHGGLHPTLDDAHRALLGEPCREDLTAMREQLRAWRSASRPAPAEPEPARTASAKITRYMGAKACGTPVGTPCQCHPGRRATTASAKTKKPRKPAKRSEPHGCGCTCPEHRGQS